MATYHNTRRGPNMASYLRNLNAQEPAVDEARMTEEDLQKDLAIFTNTNFFDFDSGQNTDYQAAAVKPESSTAAASSPTDDDAASPAEMMGDFLSLDGFVAGGDFNFGDFSTTYTSPTIPSFQDHLGNLAPIQPNPHAAYPPIPQQQQAGYAAAPAPQLGSEGHKADNQRPSPALTFEEQSRRLAEEDKRRRNTAASARFRIKKKQREQALEKSAKEMSDKVSALENRISTLETENKWLRGLVMEKHNSSGGKGEMARLLSLGNDELAKLLGRLTARADAKADTGSDAEDAAAEKAEKGKKADSGKASEEEGSKKSDRKSEKKDI